MQLTRRPSRPTRGAKKKQKVIIHPTSVTSLQQIRVLRVPAVLDGYQCVAGSIFQRTASAEPDLPSADCDLVPSLVESSDSESDVDNVNFFSTSPQDRKFFC